jgi:polyhydroxyalkanoate synthase subunit PhaC
MSALDRVMRAPIAALETANIMLTTDDAAIGSTPREVVWTHRKTTLYRYRSNDREHAVPVLLVFALINRPDIFDLRPGNSFVEFLLGQGFDVWLLDWGVPDEEDGDTGLEYYVCDAIPWALREVTRRTGEPEVSLVGWCIGGALCAMYAALEDDDGPVRNLVLLTTPVDTTGALYTTWVGTDDFDVDYVAAASPVIQGRAVDFANKLMKPVTNFWTTNRRLAQQVYEGNANREAFQTMAKWVADNPPFPSRAYREWITWMYKENRLVRGRMRLRDRRVDLADIDHDLLVITAGADHIAPRVGTLPLLDLVSSKDVTHFDRPGGHIGLMAGSKAKKEIWPDLAEWLAARSGR